MSISIDDYTTYDDIRAALGVTAKDLPDTTLALDIYSNYLELEMYEVDSTVQTTYETLVVDPSPTAAESRFIAATRFFAIYCVAKHLTTSLPLFAPRQISDGKATLARFDNPYRDTIASVHQMYDMAKNRLATALSDIGTAVATKTPLTYFSIITPSSDPVTGT